MTPYTPQRGFTLLVAIVLSSVALSVGLALLDIAYKQSILASASKQSQIAFYNADAALECALYWDQQKAFFNTSNPFNLVESDLRCNDGGVTFVGTIRSGSKVETVFTIPCSGGGTSAEVTVRKNETGTYQNAIYAKGYNSCDTTNQRRIERGLKVTY